MKATLRFAFVPAKKQPIGNARYIHRARAVKANSPTGIYASFNLSSNKSASNKPTTDRGSIIFG